MSMLSLSTQNIELLQQFISPYSGKLLESTVTGEHHVEVSPCHSSSSAGVCRLQRKKLAAAIEKAMDEGNG